MRKIRFYLYKNTPVFDVVEVLLILSFKTKLAEVDKKCYLMHVLKKRQRSRKCPHMAINLQNFYFVYRFLPF